MITCKFLNVIKNYDEYDDDDGDDDDDGVSTTMISSDDITFGGKNGNGDALLPPGPPSYHHVMKVMSCLRNSPAPRMNHQPLIVSYPFSTQHLRMK